jgi:hypothetical protein
VLPTKHEKSFRHLVLRKFDHVIGNVTQLEVGVAVVPEIGKRKVEIPVNIKSQTVFPWIQSYFFMIQSYGREQFFRHFIFRPFGIRKFT